MGDYTTTDAYEDGYDQGVVDAQAMSAGEIERLTAEVQALTSENRSMSDWASQHAIRAEKAEATVARRESLLDYVAGDPGLTRWKRDLIYAELRGLESTEEPDVVQGYLDRLRNMGPSENLAKAIDEVERERNETATSTS